MAAKSAALEIRPEAVEQPLSGEELAERRGAPRIIGEDAHLRQVSQQLHRAAAVGLVAAAVGGAFWIAFGLGVTVAAITGLMVQRLVDDALRRNAVNALQAGFEDIARRRNVTVGATQFFAANAAPCDPTLQRATGFLIPSYRTDSTLGSGFRLPYFIKMGDHRDLLLAPFLRRFGQYTVPDFLGARYGGVLYVDSLSAASGPVPTYLDLLKVYSHFVHNMNPADRKSVV